MVRLIRLPVAIAAAVAMAVLALLLAGAPPAAASSYGGTGDWVIPANTTENVVVETINVSGNLTVHGTLNLFASTVTVDRNITVAGALHVFATTVTMTADGPGTNYVDVRPGATLELSDLDGNPATTADAGVLQTNAYAFNGTVGPNATLRFINARVVNAGWQAPMPHIAGAGFSASGAVVRIVNTTFRNGWEVFVLRGATNLTVENATFDGAAVAINITGGSGHQIGAVTLVNHTYGLLLRGTDGTNVSAMTVNVPRLLPYQPPGAGPPGSGVDAEACTNLTVGGLSIQGLPAPVGSPAQRGFVLRNTTGATIQQVSAVWAGSVGRIEGSSSVRLEEVVVADSVGPLQVVNSTAIVVLSLTLQNGNSGLSLTNVSAWYADRILAVGLTAGAVTGLNMSGDGWLSNISAENGTVLASFDFEGAGRLTVRNATARVMQGGLVVSGLAPVVLDVDGLGGTTLSEAVLSVSVRDLAGATVANVTANVTGSPAVSMTGDRITNSSVGPITVIDPEDVGIAVDFRFVNATFFHDVHADNLTGTAFVLTAAGGVIGSTFRSFLGVNTTGVLLDIVAGAVLRLTVSQFTVVDGLMVPADGDGAVMVVSDLVAQSTFADIALDRSLVGAVNVTAGAGSQFNVSDIRGNAISAPAVSVDCRGQSCNVRVTGVTLTNSLDTGVQVMHTRGSVAVQGVVTDTPFGVWADDAQGLVVSQLVHNGTGPAVGLVNSFLVQVDNSTLSGAAGLVSDGGSSIWLVDVVSYVDGATVQARVTSILTVSRIVFADAGAGLRLLGATDVIAEDLSGSVQDYVLFASQDATRVTLRRVSMGTAAGFIAGTVVTASRAHSLSITDYNFSGPCGASASFQLVDGLDVVRFRSNGCGTGLEVTNSQRVNLTALTLTDTAGGAALSVTASSQVRVVGADLQRAGGQALELGNGLSNVLSGLNGSDSRGDGALFVFTTHTLLQDSVFDRATAVSLFFIGAGPNLTLVNVSGRWSGQGAEMLDSQGVVLDRVNLSHNLGFGYASNLLSTGNTLRDMEVHGGRSSGIQVLANGTSIIDGNFSGNAQGAIVAGPLVRIDWHVTRSAALTDDAVNLTGDLVLEPGATFSLVRSRLVIDETARLAALQPITVINVSAGARMVVRDSSITARDVLVPYAIVVGTGGLLDWDNATVNGGNATSPLSAVRLQSATAVLRGGSMSGWHVPIDATNATVVVDRTRFQNNWQGPSVSGGTAQFSNVTSISNAGDGLLVVGLARFDMSDYAAFNNGGSGATFETVGQVVLRRVDARANGGAGLLVVASGLDASHLSLVGNALDGLSFTGPGGASLLEVEADSNGRSGVAATGASSVVLSGLFAEANGGSGLLLTGVSVAAVDRVTVGRNEAFGLRADGSGALDLRGGTFTDDVLGSLRLEGALSASISNLTVNAAADYAIAATGRVDLSLTGVVATAALAPLIATDEAVVRAVNCTLGDPVVLSKAVVLVGWHVRVVVQDAAGGPGASVSVVVYNATGEPTANGTTDAGGTLPLVTVYERLLRGDGSRERFTPHTFAAQHATLGRATVVVEVNRFVSVAMRLDDQLPTLNVEYSTSPSSTGWFLGPVSVTLRAIDDRGGGVTMSWRYPSGGWTTLSSNESAVVVTLEVASEGTTHIEVVIQDMAGNVLGPQTIDVRIDLAPPTGAFGEYEEVYFSPTIMLRWSGSDGNGSGVSSYRVEYSRNNGQYATLLDATTRTSSVFEAVDGDYRFRLTVFDQAGRSSPPAYLDVVFALVGGVRVRVLDVNGVAIANTSVHVEDVNVTLVGEGDLEITGLPAGNHTIVISAPGHEAVRREVNITARQTLDLGEVVLPSQGGTVSTELVILWGLLAGVGLATVSYWLYLRQKWSGRKKGPRHGEP